MIAEGIPNWIHLEQPDRFNSGQGKQTLELIDHFAMVACHDVHLGQVGDPVGSIKRILAHGKHLHCLFLEPNRVLEAAETGTLFLLGKTMEGSA